MRTTTLLRRSLTHYWRTNLAVVAGVAIAVAVLAGALTVGVSVRASLRDLVVQRLGETDLVVLSAGFFREELASEIASHGRFTQRFETAAPLVALEGFVTDQAGGRRASRVQVYAVDDRFWKFHHLVEMTGPGGNDALLSESLAREIGTLLGQSVLLRIESASAIPTESLHGRKEDVGRTVRLTVRQVLPARDLGEFSLSPRQGSVRAIFVPLRRMQTVLQQPEKVNAVLVDVRASAAGASGTDGTDLERIVDETARLDDLGLRLRALEERHSLALESSSTVISDPLAATAQKTAERLGMKTLPTLAYLANTIRSRGREIPYSVIAALDLNAAGLRPEPVEAQSPEPKAQSPIVLNTWAAKELGARVGDPISVDYYLWETEGRLSTRTAEFRLAAIVPIEGAAADRDLVPEYPGITDSDRLADWDPPFPIDLRRVRPADEEYWKGYRATPKAFIPIATGQQLWRSRYGSQTALRILPPDGTTLAAALDQYGRALRSELHPVAAGFSVQDVRAQSLAAANGATDFSEYFTYFSMFLVVSALLLAALFFKLGIEQRLREVGLLQALGFGPATIRRLFVGEGIVLSVAGGLVGTAGAVAYGAAIMFGLRTWWVDAVGTTALRLHVDPASLAAGAAGGVIVSVVCIWWSLRSLAVLSSRSLLMGGTRAEGLGLRAKRTRVGLAAAAFGLLAFIMLFGAVTGSVGRVAGFFGAGSLSLVAMLCVAAAWLRSGHHGTLQGHGKWPVWRLGFRNATFRPARSVLCIALIAFATFVIVAVEAFKRDAGNALSDRQSGTGGYPLLVESLLPIVHDLNSAAGREAMNLPTEGELAGVRFDRFRVRPGDDTSCLNLYQPKNPRILAASSDFVNAGRFAFQSSLADTPEETANPWRLLNREFPDGAIPVITDANSMTYVLHMKLGDDLMLPGSSDRPVRLRLVGALSDSIFQGELVMADTPFVRTFPEWEGYRFFLVDVPPERAAGVTGILESRIPDFGVDAASTSERLAGFHRVEYTYLLTFQMLGGLGLVLGTLGLGAVLLRNVLERRRELALLRALGYRQADFFAMVVAENILLLVGGLAVGTFCALLAIAPTLMDRGGRLPGPMLGVFLLGVLVTGLMASIGATAAALRSPLLPALRTE
jgi:putative ABC transport system permease protein